MRAWRRALFVAGCIVPVALAAPASAQMVDKINAEMRRMFSDPVLRQTLDREYFTPIVGSPEDLTARIQADEPKWRKVIQDAGLPPQ